MIPWALKTHPLNTTSTYRTKHSSRDMAPWFDAHITSNGAVPLEILYTFTFCESLKGGDDPQIVLYITHNQQKKFLDTCKVQCFNKIFISKLFNQAFSTKRNSTDLEFSACNIHPPLKLIEFFLWCWKPLFKNYFDMFITSSNELTLEQNICIKLLVKCTFIQINSTLNT